MCVYMYPYVQVWINMVTLDVMRDSLMGVPDAWQVIDLAEL